MSHAAADFLAYRLSIRTGQDRGHGMGGPALHTAAAALLAAFSIVSIAGPAVAQEGRASWYAHTSMTASGERANPAALTAAHRTLPFGAKVKVENLRNGRSVVVRINDRGPFAGARIIDVTRAAAEKLGFVAHGTAPVRLTVLR